MTSEIINVVAASPLGGHKLRLNFDDGTAPDEVFKPFLQRSRHPEIQGHLDEHRFSTFRVAHGELICGEYELCFPIADCFTDQIDGLHLLETAE